MAETKTYVATLTYGTPGGPTGTEEFRFRSRAVKTGTVTAHARAAAERAKGHGEFLVTAVRKEG